MPSEFYSSEMKEQLLQALLLTAAALVNVAVLFIYWLSVSRRTHGVYLLCGATRAKVVWLMLVQWGVFVLLSFLLSIGLDVIFSPLLRKITIANLPWSIGLLILLGGYAATLLFMLPQILKNANVNHRGYIR